MTDFQPTRAQAKGRAIGRPKGQEDTAAFLAKPAIQDVIKALDAGLSIRETAYKLGMSTATVQKVKQAIKEAQQADEENH